MPARVWSDIGRGGVYVEENFVEASLIARLRADSEALYRETSYFKVDGLTNTAASEQAFSVRLDRQTMRGVKWTDEAVGDAAARRELDTLMTRLRHEAEDQLDRNVGDWCPHEMTYSRYEKGAYLGRHLDEHHEETKGRDGWALPTRRSLTWLVYLNEEPESGELRCYERRRCLPNVGASPRNGDVQVAWLSGLRRGNNEFAPVYLGDDGDFLRLYSFDAATKKETSLATRIPRPFDLEASRTLLGPQLLPLFPDTTDDDNLRLIDIKPQAGTLVIFDSVAVSHEVLQWTSDKPRLAITGWFHEPLPIVNPLII